MPYGHASTLLLGEGSEATEPYNKYDKIRPHSIRSLQFDQKIRPLSFRPEKFDPCALNAGAKRSGATCHMAMPQCCYLAKGAKRPSHTTNTIKFDRIPFDPCNSIKRFDLCPFDQKNSTYLQPPVPGLHREPRFMRLGTKGSTTVTGFWTFR